jgi:hypothetical protein
MRQQTSAAATAANLCLQFLVETLKTVALGEQLLARQ